jgi:hypothetical protein
MINSTLALKSSENPFNSMFIAAYDESQPNTVEAKTRFIVEVIKALEHLENNAENEAIPMYWASVASALSSTAVIFGTAAINPILGIIAASVSVTSALSAIGMATYKHRIDSRILEGLKKYRLALETKPPITWASIWQAVGTDTFLISLSRGASGELVDGQLCRARPALNEVVDTAAQLMGMDTQSFSNMIQNGLPAPTQNPNQREIAPSFTPALPEVTSPTSLDDLYKVAIASRDALVGNATNSCLPGCIILAAPGTGKSTYLGTVWGNLKKQHGDNFRSLAVVVKRDDEQGFKGFANEVVCCNDKPRQAAIAVIKFINEGMTKNKYVNRLFIDDYLSAQKIFKNSLKGMFIDIETFKLYDSKTDAKDSGASEYVPAYDHLITSLNQLWLVGREYNSCLHVSSHSVNVEDLEFVSSASARSVGDFIFLAKNDKREFIELALKNDCLISDANRRTAIKEQLNLLSVTTGEPIILTNQNNWSLGVVPKSIRGEYESLISNRVDTQPKENAAATTLQIDSDDTTADTESDDLLREWKAAKLGISKDEFTLLIKIQKLNKNVTIREIVQSKPYGRDGNSTSKIKYYLDELIIKELLLKDGDTYKPSPAFVERVEQG